MVCVYGLEEESFLQRRGPRDDVALFPTDALREKKVVPGEMFEDCFGELWEVGDALIGKIHHRGCT